MTYCSRKIIVLILSQFSSSHVRDMPSLEQRKQPSPFKPSVLLGVSCRQWLVAVSSATLTGLISNLFHKKLTCLEGIHGPTFVDFVGKFQVCIYLKLCVKAYWTIVILLLLCFVLVLPSQH